MKNTLAEPRNVPRDWDKIDTFTLFTACGNEGFLTNPAVHHQLMDTPLVKRMIRWSDHQAAKACFLRTFSVSSNGGNAKTAQRDVPLMFADSAWDKLNTTIISTSNCGNPALRMFGFGPVSADGFGIGYIIKDDSISVCVASKHRQTKRFVDTLNSYLQDVRYLIRQHKKLSLPSTTKAREAEAKQAAAGNKSTRGKEIATKLMSAHSSPSDSDGEDGMLGGYGYFDLGSLNRLLSEKDESSVSENVVAAKRAIGRKLRLAEY